MATEPAEVFEQLNEAENTDLAENQQISRPKEDARVGEMVKKFEEMCTKEIKDKGECNKPSEVDPKDHKALAMNEPETNNERSVDEPGSPAEHSSTVENSSLEELKLFVDHMKDDLNAKMSTEEKEKIVDFYKTLHDFAGTYWIVNALAERKLQMSSDIGLGSEKDKEEVEQISSDVDQENAEEEGKNELDEHEKEQNFSSDIDFKKSEEKRGDVPVSSDTNFATTGVKEKQKQLSSNDDDLKTTEKNEKTEQSLSVIHLTEGKGILRQASSEAHLSSDDTHASSGKSEDELQSALVNLDKTLYSMKRGVAYIFGNQQGRDFSKDLKKEYNATMKFIYETVTEAPEKETYSTAVMIADELKCFNDEVLTMIEALSGLQTRDDVRKICQSSFDIIMELVDSLEEGMSQ